MKRFFYKWFIAALVVAGSLTAFSCIAYKKARTCPVEHPTAKDHGAEDLLPWSGLSVRMPGISPP